MKVEAVKYLRDSHTRIMETHLDITIKPATKEGALAIAQSLPDFFNETGILSITKDLENHELWGAYVQEELAGFITLRKASKGSLEISWLAVKKDFQGVGVGSKLVKEVLRRFANQGFTVCYVKTLAETAEDEGYEKTRAFYKTLGFHTLEIIDPYPGWSEGNPCQILAAALPLA